jgi:hypothetical protein
VEFYSHLNIIALTKYQVLNIGINVGISHTRNKGQGFKGLEGKGVPYDITL